jgi:hypothetical protein
MFSKNLRRVACAPSVKRNAPPKMGCVPSRPLRPPLQQNEYPRPLLQTSGHRGVWVLPFDAFGMSRPVIIRFPLGKKR